MNIVKQQPVSNRLRLPNINSGRICASNTRTRTRTTTTTTTYNNNNNNNK